MLFLTVTTCLAITVQAGCPMRPTAEQTSASRTTGDGDYRILVSGKADKYIPNAVYTVSLQGNDVCSLQRPRYLNCTSYVTS